MNYKNESIRELLKYGIDFPEYSLGDLLFSVLQPVAIANNKGSVAWIRDIQDSQFFSFIEKARELEKEDLFDLKFDMTETEIISILTFKK